MTALTPSIGFSMAGIIVLMTSASGYAAGNAPTLPGPYQSMQYGSETSNFAQPQAIQPQQNIAAQPNRAPAIDTFPTHSFPMPYWMQSGSQNSGNAGYSQNAAASNSRPNQLPQQNPNNGGWGNIPNNSGYVRQPTSEFFPSYGFGFGANASGTFGAYPNANAIQPYQNNNAPTTAYPAQGYNRPAPNWGMSWNGFGYGQMANPWGQNGYQSANGFNNGSYGNSNMMQR